MTTIRLPHDNVTALRVAIQGHTMEHGVAPDFIIMSQDVAMSIFEEARVNSAYKGVVQTSAGKPLSIMGIELAQGQGQNRVELVCDLALVKARRAGRIA